MITLKMSLTKNSGVKMGSEDWGRDEPPCCSEDPAGSSLEPNPSLNPISAVHSCPQVKGSSPVKFSIHDTDHKVIVMDSGTLKAVPYKTYILPETFFLLGCHLNSPCKEKGGPVFLAVSKGKRCLCCVKAKGQHKPSLQLKKRTLEDLSAQMTQAPWPFIFYRTEVGSLNTLESAAYPGWFICTSRNSGEPIGVTNSRGRRKHTEFSFQEVPKVEMNPSEVRK